MFSAWSKVFFASKKAAFWPNLAGYFRPLSWAIAALPLFVANGKCYTDAMTEFPKVNPALNEKWLKRAAWWVKHRGQLRALLIGFVIFIDGVLIIFSGYGWVDFGLLSRQKERDMFLEMTKPPTILSLRGSIGPRDLAAPLVVTLSGSRQEGKYDALVKFVNPNNNYVAKIKFHGVGDAVTEPQSVVVLNNDERLAIIGGVARSSATNPRIIINNI